LVLFSSPTVHTETCYTFSHTAVALLLLSEATETTFFSPFPSITWISLGDCYRAVSTFDKGKELGICRRILLFWFPSGQRGGNNIRFRLFALGSRRKLDRLLIFHR
jgi:hypothetical protein